MDPRHLVQLAAILEKGSITAASRYLHLTQPTLTHNMQTLEMQAGGQLFVRSRLGVRSTPLGELLAREGRDIQRRVHDAGLVSARHRLGMHRQVKIGAGPMIGASLLPGVTERLLAAHPDVALVLQTDRPHLLVDQLVDGLHDLVIAPSWLDKPPKGIDRTLLLADTLGVFCGTSHPLAASGRLGRSDGDRARWLTLGLASPFDKDVFGMLDEAGASRARSEVTVLGDATALLRILMRGQHLAVLPRFPVHALRPLFPLAELTIGAAARPRPIHVWCREALLDDPAFVRIRRIVIDHATEVSARQQAAPSPPPRSGRTPQRRGPRRAEPGGRPSRAGRGP